MQIMEAIPALIQTLKNRGFDNPTREPDRWITLKGSLRTSMGPIPCHFSFDPTFFELPRIRLTPVPRSLEPVAPHLDNRGHLCYLTKKSIVLDIFDPIGQTLMCLERAEYVLDKILKREMIEDLTEEFLAYWKGAFCFVDIQNLSPGPIDAVPATRGTWTLLTFTDDAKRTSEKLSLLRFNSLPDKIPAYVINSKCAPRPSQTEWPPKTVRELIVWQQRIDRNCAKKISQRIAESAKSPVKRAAFLINTPTVLFGFDVDFSKVMLSPRRQTTARGIALTNASRITPLTAIRIDDGFITQRNMPGRKSLAGKHVALVGCGTIGGYLATLLTRAGAGSNTGCLTLIDDEFLLPQNVGRHTLGINSLLTNKAKALATSLRTENPTLNIRPLEKDVREIPLEKQDLIIDATGEEALGHWLAARYSRSKTILSIWIEGPGAAVRGLIHTPGNGACFRCISDYQRNGELKPVNETVPYALMGDGCDEMYTPFPASVSMQAAALAAEMTLDWVNDTLTPHIRTRAASKGYTAGTPDHDPQARQGCPACDS